MMAITPNSVAALEWLFEKSIKENSVTSTDDNCAVTRLNAPGGTVEGKNRKLIVLNISSYTFRVVALFDFDLNDVTTEHLAKVLRSPKGDLKGQSLLDAYAEFVNMICGTVNRQLSSEFRHVGMSTPLFLDTECASYADILKPAQTMRFDVTVNEATRFKIAIFVCIAKNATLDFHVNRFDVAEASTGELELF
ncbi:hypothetical protein DLREEDagrD3_16820 [Denitratisoma sp. agr-D3]